MRDDPPRVRRRVFTAEDVLAIVRMGGTELVMGPQDRLTALARDTLRDKGIGLVGASAQAVGTTGVPTAPGRSGAPAAGVAPVAPFAPPSGSLGVGPVSSAPVSPVPVSPVPVTSGPVGSLPGPSRPDVSRETGSSFTAGGGVPRLVHVRDVGKLGLDPFPDDTPPAGMDVKLRDVVTARDGLPMAVGVMSLREGAFPWHLDYDEIEYVLEGELHITTAAEKVIGRPGDVIAVPKGSSITFGTPNWAKFLYVTYPADWSGAS